MMMRWASRDAAGRARSTIDRSIRRPCALNKSMMGILSVESIGVAVRVTTELDCSIERRRLRRPTDHELKPQQRSARRPILPPAGRGGRRRSAAQSRRRRRARILLLLLLAGPIRPLNRDHTVCKPPLCPGRQPILQSSTFGHLSFQLPDGPSVRSRSRGQQQDRERASEAASEVHTWGQRVDTLYDVFDLPVSYTRISLRPPAPTGRGSINQIVWWDRLIGTDAHTLEGNPRRSKAWIERRRSLSNQYRTSTWGGRPKPTE